MKSAEQIRVSIAALKKTLHVPLLTKEKKRDIVKSIQVLEWVLQ